VVQVKRDEVKEQVDEHKLDDVVDVYLTEMDTVTLLDMPGVSVSVDAEDAESVRFVCVCVCVCSTQCIYIALLSKVLYSIASHSPIHYTDGGADHAR